MLKSRLLPEIADKLLHTHVLIGQIAETMNTTPYTVNKWRRNCDPQLTLPVPVKMIKEHLNIPDGQDITEIYETEPKFSTVN